MGQNAEPGPDAWGFVAGLTAGLLSGSAAMIHYATTSDLRVGDTLLMGGLCGIPVAFAVGGLVNIGLSTRDRLKKHQAATSALAAMDAWDESLNKAKSYNPTEREAQQFFYNKAAQLDAEERSRRLRQRQEYLYGRNAVIVESALDSVNRVVASEAARTGWLGDVDFGPDTKVIADNLQKAHALRKVADRLSGLDNPGADDRKILKEANTTIAKLETIALKRVKLIAQCATEAELIDESLRKERADAHTAQQRAALHAKLSGMLYGIEATPTATSMESGVDGVMARVQAYREVKNAIKQARGESSV